MGCMHSTEAVIFSFNGTLVDTTGIRHLVAGHQPVCDAPRADRFLLESVFCPPVQQVVQLLKLERSMGRKVIIVTEVRDHYRPHIQSWLDLQEVLVDEIRFRQVSDHRPDAFTKGEIAAAVQKEYDVVHAYESRTDVARAYERLGIPVTVTAGRTARRPAMAAAA